MKPVYNIKNLSRVGVLILFLLVILLLLGYFFIPKFSCQQSEHQIYTLKHKYLKFENDLYVSNFLHSIKRNNGYLILGTSESNQECLYGNYYDFLNADTTLPVYFSLISGAGRTASTYYASLIRYEEFQNLKVIYYINPIYWTNNLVKSDLDYFSRYVNYHTYFKTIKNNPEFKVLSRIGNMHRKQENPLYVISDFFEYYMTYLRRSYYQDLRFYLNPEQYYHSIIPVNSVRKLSDFQFFGVPDTTLYDMKNNHLKSFNTSSLKFKVDTNLNFRYEELSVFIALCKQRKIDITFFIGPYNASLYRCMSPEEIMKFEYVIQHVRNLLEEEQCSYIDGSDISNKVGIFNDYQHHSSYGGYFIYEKIRRYVLEKEGK